MEIACGLDSLNGRLNEDRTGEREDRERPTHRCKNLLPPIRLRDDGPWRGLDRQLLRPGSKNGIRTDGCSSFVAGKK